MNTAFQSYLRQRGDKRTSQVVEDAVQRRKEDALLRLARITNGKHPDYKNALGKKG
jgi:hypothetical protein